MEILKCYFYFGKNVHLVLRFNFLILVFPALPALYKKPTSEMNGTSITIRWIAWDKTIDYGTGPAEKYRLYYAKQNQSLVPSDIVYGTETRIEGLEKETEYVFAVSVFRTIDSNSTEGTLSPEETVRTPCGGKLSLT